MVSSDSEMCDVRQLAIDKFITLILSWSLLLYLYSFFFLHELIVGRDIACLYSRYYELMKGSLTQPPQRTTFGPMRNLYKNSDSGKFLFWSSVPGRGWSIGPALDSPDSHQNSRAGRNISTFKVSTFSHFRPGGFEWGLWAHAGGLGHYWTDHWVQGKFWKYTNTLL